MILDELRSEAQRCRAAMESLQSQRPGTFHGAEGHVADISLSFPQDPGSCLNTAFLQEGAMPGVLENLQFSDWQMLDSSVSVALQLHYSMLSSLKGLLALIGLKLRLSHRLSWS